MPFDGSGNYQVLGSPTFPAVAGNTIKSSYFNAIVNDMASAMSNVLCRDGQSTVTADISLNTHRLTNVAAPTTGTDAATRNWVDWKVSRGSIKASGAVGDGVADDRAALAAADALGHIVLPAGNYLIASNITVTNSIWFEPGAVLVIPNGVTVTLNGYLHAVVYQIFNCTGTGKVVPNARKTPMGYPEWWGAKADQSVDCLAALHACRDAMMITMCSGGDYLISGTLKWNKARRVLQGINCQYDGAEAAAATRILISDGSANICQFGLDANPGSINSQMIESAIRDVYFGRSVAPVIASNCVGVKSQWSLYGYLERVKAADSMIGFRENGVVHLKKIHCSAVRAQAGTGGGTDYFVGHYADGSGSIGAAGGNASLYNIYCNAGCNYGPLQTASGSYGFKADQSFTDVWYWSPETTQFYVGQGVFGNDSAALTFSNTNFTIFHPIHDQFTFAGTYIADIATAGSVAIVEPYYGPATTARAAHWVNSSEGNVTLRGGQFVMGGAPLVQAILLLSSRGCDILGYPVILEHGNNYAACGLSDVNDCRIEVFGKNPTVSAGALVQLAGTCTAVVAVPKCSGKASAWQYGIQVVGAGDNRNEYQVSGLQSGALVAANRKLDRNGTPVTAIGLTGTNYATGVFT